VANILSRRGFLVGCSSAIAAMAGARLTNLAFAEPEAAAGSNDEILVVVFLRGGWDALNVIPPIDGTDRGLYEQARPGLRIPTTGVGAALRLNAQFGMHPAMAPLLPFYQAGKLAIVHACGLRHDTRSHFDAMQFMELGTPGSKTTTSGWITRHLQSLPGVPSTNLIPAISAGGQQSMSLLNYDNGVSMSRPQDFQLSGNWRHIDNQRQTLRNLYSGTNWLDLAGTETLDTLDLIDTANPGDYTPGAGAIYPGGGFGDNLKTIAQLIKMQLGLRVATIDLGGWDTHEGQGDGSGGYLANNQLKPLAEGLAAFYTDIDGCGTGFAQRTTIVVMSEFGRRLKENANGGTDHGHGSAMLVLGGGVNGGRVYADWPGLANAQLYDGYDLAVTTDYRRILSDILTRRLGNSDIEAVFPGYATSYTPLDIVRIGAGTTQIPTYQNKVYLPQIAKQGGVPC
jgi:uncharacterized protein (DUF1501 family)